MHAPSRHTVGTAEWWAAVVAAREANDEHMAEEEREGIADFRARPGRAARVAGPRFARFFEQHPTTAGVDIADKDPERYVEDIEQELIGDGRGPGGDGSLGSAV